MSRPIRAILYFKPTPTRTAKALFFKKRGPPPKPPLSEISRIESSGESTLATIVSAGNLTLSEAGAPATYTQAPNSSITTQGSLVIKPGATLAAPVNSESPTFLNVGKDWINQGMFVAGSSTVMLTGPEDATVFGDNTFNHFTVIEPSKSVSFEAGKTQTVAGVLTLQGDFGKLLVLRSTSASIPWKISAIGTTTISYVLVQNSENVHIHGPPLKALHSDSLGNNTYWDLDPIWTGAGVTNNWSDAFNWDTGTSPISNSIVTFNSDAVTYPNANKDSLIDADFQGTVLTWTVAGYTGAITFARDLTVTGNFSQSTGTLNLLNNTLTVGGDFSHTAGIFNAGTSTVIFNDASKSSAIYGDTTFYNFKSLTPGKIIYFEAGKTQTILGTWTIHGASGQYVKLLSNQEGAQWLVNPSGPRDLDYVWVQDSYNLDPAEILMTHSSNQGNTFNWDPPRYWVGNGGNTSWNNTANWSTSSGGAGGASVPGASNDVFFDGGTGGTSADGDCVIDAAVNVASITITSSYDGNFDNGTNDQSVTVSGDVTIDGTGTLDMGAATWTLHGNFDFADVGVLTGDESTLIMDGTSKNLITSSSGLKNVTLSGTITITSPNDGISVMGGGTLTISGTVDLEPLLLAFEDVKITSSGHLSGGGLLAIFAQNNFGGLSQQDGIIDTNNSIIVPNTGLYIITEGSAVDQATLIVPATYDCGVTFTNDSTSDGSHTMKFSNGTYTFKKDVAFGVSLDKPLVVDNSVNNPNLIFQGNVTFFTGLITWTKGTGTITLSGGSGTNTLDFDGQSIEAVTVNASSVVKQLTTHNVTMTSLTVAAGTYDANGRTTTVTGLTTVSGGTYLASSAAQTLGALTVSGGTFNIGTSTSTAGTVTLTSGTISGSSGTLTGTSYAVQSGTISGILAGSGIALTKSTSGTVTVSSANTYTGATTISAGTLAVTINNALGTNAAGTTVASGATLDFQNVTYSTTEALTVNGGTIAASTGTSSFAGAITLGADSTVTVAGTQLTLSGAMSAANFSLTVNGAGNTILSGAVSSLNNLTHSGAGTLQLSTNALTTGGTFTNSTGTFDANGLAHTVTGLATISGGTYTASTAQQTFNGGLTVSGGTFTGASNSLADVNGDFNLSSGTFTAPGATGTFTVSGNFTISAGTFTHNSGTVTLDGTGVGKTFSVVNSTSFSTFTVNSSDGTGYWTLSGTALNAPNATLNFTSGTFDQGSAGLAMGTVTTTVVNVNGGTLKGSPVAGFSAKTLNITSGSFIAGTSVSLGSTAVVGTYVRTAPGTVDWTTNSCLFTWRTNTTVNVPVDTYFSLTLNTLTTTTAVFNLSGDTAINGNLSINRANVGSNDTLAMTTYNLTVLGNVSLSTTTSALSATTGNITVGGNWAATGVFTPGTGTVFFNKSSGTQTLNNGTSSFNNLTHSGAGTLQPQSNSPDVNGDFSQTAGTLDLTNTGLTVAGNFSLSSGTTVTKGVNGITFDGTSVATYTDSTATPQNIGAVTINKTNGTASNNKLTLASSMTVDTMTISASNTLDLASSGYTLTLANAGAVADVLTVSGTLTPGTSTVKYSATNSGGDVNVAATTYNSLQLSGAETYDLAGNLTSGNALTGNLTIDLGATLDAVSGSNFGITLAGNWSNSGTFTSRSGTVTLNGTDQTVSGSTSFNNLTKTVTTARTLTFQAGSTQTIAGTLDLEGALGNLLSLRSSSSGTQWNINPQGVRTIQFLDVKDSNNINATVISGVGLNVTDSGNNTGWTFSGPTPSGLINNPTALNNAANQVHNAMMFNPQLGFISLGEFMAPVVALVPAQGSSVLPKHVDQTFFKGASVSLFLPEPFDVNAFHGVNSNGVLPQPIQFQGLGASVFLPEPVSFKGAFAPDSQLPDSFDPSVFQGVNSNVILPQPETVAPSPRKYEDFFVGVGVTTLFTVKGGPKPFEEMRVEVLMPLEVYESGKKPEQAKSGAGQEPAGQNSAPVSKTSKAA